jgi:hypothetical protein
LVILNFGVHYFQPIPFRIGLNICDMALETMRSGNYGEKRTDRPTRSIISQLILLFSCPDQLSSLL